MNNFKSYVSDDAYGLVILTPPIRSQYQPISLRVQIRLAVLNLTANLIICGGASCVAFSELNQNRQAFLPVVL